MNIWQRIDNLTTPNNTYFGHEIHEILDLVGNLLDRQKEEFEADGSDDRLLPQINSTQYGTSIVSNLISNVRQWRFLTQVCWKDFEIKFSENFHLIKKNSNEFRQIVPCRRFIC